MSLSERQQAAQRADAILRLMAEFGELALTGKTSAQREAARKEWQRLNRSLGMNPSRFAYSAQTRFHVLSAVDSGRPLARVAEDFGISPSTIRAWRRARREGAK